MHVSYVVGLLLTFVNSNVYSRDLNEIFKNKLLPWKVTKKLIPWDLMFIVYLKNKIEPQVTGTNFLLC